MQSVTTQLRLAAITPGNLLALIDGPEPFASSFGTPAADGLRGFLVSGEVSPDWLARLQTCPAADPWTHGFAVVHNEQNLVIGMVGFKGPPGEAGTVEIAYAIVPQFEGRGYATEAATAATGWALGPGKARSVLAHTLPTPNASTRVLKKCGFRFVGEVVDPDDGPVWRWKRDAKSTSG